MPSNGAAHETARVAQGGGAGRLRGHGPTLGQVVDSGRSAVHRAQVEELAAGVLDDEPDDELPGEEPAAGVLDDEPDDELLEPDEPESDDELLEPDEPDEAGAAADFESRESVR